MQITNYQEVRPAMRVPGKVSLARKEIDTTIICGVRTMFTTVVKRPSMKSPKKGMTPDKVSGKVMTPDNSPEKITGIFRIFIFPATPLRGL
jgi:hypothetical protein